MAGRRFAQDFQQISAVKSQDKILIQDSTDGVAKVATINQLNTDRNDVVQTSPQQLTDAQKAQARQNIGALQILTFDTTPAIGSGNPVTSNGIKLALNELAAKIAEIIVAQYGFYIVDNNLNVGLKYDSNGLDCAMVSEHFKSLLPSGGGGGQDTRIISVAQNGFYVVDNNLNIGFYVNSTGAHSANLVEFTNQ